METSADARVDDRHRLRPQIHGSWRETYRQRLFRHAPADHDPVILRHRRIYILPTKRGIAFLATLAMTLLTSLNYSLSLGFATTFLLGGTRRGIAHPHVSQSRGHRASAARRGRDVRGQRDAVHAGTRGGATPRYAITLSARGCFPVTVDVVPDSALPVALELLTPRRGRIVLGRITLSSDFPIGLWHGWAYVHFPLAGIAFPTPKFAPPPLPAGTAGQDDHLDVARRLTATLRDCAPISREIRCSVSRGKRSRAESDGTRSNSKAAAAAVRSTSIGMPCRAKLDPKVRIARLTAWVLAAERAARPFALTAPGIALAHRAGTRASPRRADRARADARAHAMTHGCIRRSSAARAPGRRVVTLSPSQLRWLGALLLATQLPMLGYVPVWVACLGTLLVALRFLLVARSVKNRDPAPEIDPLVGARAARARDRAWRSATRSATSSAAIPASRSCSR